MSEEGAPTVRVSPADTHTDPLACSSSSIHTVGMQQQTPADTEEKRVSSFSAVFSALLRPDAPVIWAQLESSKLNSVLQRVFYLALGTEAFFKKNVFVSVTVRATPLGVHSAVRALFFGSEPWLES